MNNVTPFAEQDHKTWKLLFTQQDKLRDQQIIPEFSEGLDLLGITSECIPNLDLVNKKLYNLTGWQGVYVNGFEEPKTFFKMYVQIACDFGVCFMSSWYFPSAIELATDRERFHI